MVVLRRNLTKTKEIYLKKASWENYRKILRLRVTKEQNSFAATNKTSLIHAFLSSSAGITVYAFGILKRKASSISASLG